MQIFKSQQQVFGVRSSGFVSTRIFPQRPGRVEGRSGGTHPGCQGGMPVAMRPPEQVPETLRNKRGHHQLVPRTFL